MYDNSYIGFQNLRKAPKIRPGGLCKIYVALHKDVAEWPVVDPSTGVINEPLSLKTGATLFLIEPSEKDRSFVESSKRGSGGDFMDMQVSTNLAGNTINNSLALTAALNTQFVLIVQDRNGDQRLIGTEDAGAVLVFDYTSGNSSASRYRSLKWQYQHAMPAPIYMGGTVILDDQTSVFNALTLVARFRVGNPGAPMVDGETNYINPALVNSQFIFLADGKAIHQITDNPSERYCTKPYSSNNIFVNGGVNQNEAIEIYKF